jgi:hypothetical protein
MPAMNELISMNGNRVRGRHSRTTLPCHAGLSYGSRIRGSRNMASTPYRDLPIKDVLWLGSCLGGDIEGPSINTSPLSPTRKIGCRGSSLTAARRPIRLKISLTVGPTTPLPLVPIGSSQGAVSRANILHINDIYEWCCLESFPKISRASCRSQSSTKYIFKPQETPAYPVGTNYQQKYILKPQEKTDPTKKDDPDRQRSASGPPTPYPEITANPRKNNALSNTMLF